MTFGMVLAEHLTMSASASMFYIAVHYKNKTVAASKKILKYISCFLSKNLLDMKMVVNYLNFVLHLELKTKSRYKILNFVFQFVKNTK